MDTRALNGLLEKVPFTLLLLAYLASLGWDFYNFRSAEDSPLAMKNQDVVAAQQELTKLKSKVQEAQTFLRGLDGKKNELRRLSQDLESTKTILSEDMDVPALMKAVLTEAKMVGLNIVSLKPGQMNNVEFYSEQVFDLSFKGVYFQLVGFLDRVSSLQKIIRVDSLEIARINTSVARYVEVQGTIQLKAFKYNRSKADELLKAQQQQPTSGVQPASATAPQVASQAPTTPGTGGKGQ